MKIYPNHHGNHPPTTETTTNGECRGCYREAQREWVEKNRDIMNKKRKYHRDFHPSQDVTRSLDAMKCNHCGYMCENLRDLATHKRGHNHFQQTERIISLTPSTMCQWGGFAW